VQTTHGQLHSAWGLGACLAALLISLEHTPASAQQGADKRPLTPVHPANVPTRSTSCVAGKQVTLGTAAIDSSSSSQAHAVSTERS
jgi:hypothetical protein